MAGKEELILGQLREINKSLKDLTSSVIQLETREERYEAEIKELKGDMKAVLQKELPEVKSEITGLKTKASVWGAFAAAVVTTLITIGVKLGDMFLRN